MYNYGPNLISKEKSIFFYEFFFSLKKLVIGTTLAYKKAKKVGMLLKMVELTDQLGDSQPRT